MRFDRAAAVAFALAAGVPLPNRARAETVDAHPATYIDEGACPFECCTYRQWAAEAPTRLHAVPSRTAPVIHMLKRGEPVTAVTGKVLTEGRRFVVKRDHADHRRGDVLWVYTYLGEGVFRVWYGDHMEDEELDFSPYPGGTGGERCQESTPVCWGELDQPLKMTWWIKLRSERGVEGWTDEEDNFSGADACG